MARDSWKFLETLLAAEEASLEKRMPSALKEFATEKEVSEARSDLWALVGDISGAVRKDAATAALSVAATLCEKSKSAWTRCLTRKSRSSGTT